MSIKLKLFPKKHMTEIPSELLEEMKTAQASTADRYSQLLENVSMGAEFNLVRIVEEHGPKRLEQIDSLIKGYQDKIGKLVREREQVQALVLALK